MKKTTILQKYTIGMGKNIDRSHTQPQDKQQRTQGVYNDGLCFRKSTAKNTLHPDQEIHVTSESF